MSLPLHGTGINSLSMSPELLRGEATAGDAQHFHCLLCPRPGGNGSWCNVHHLSLSSIRDLLADALGSPETRREGGIQGWAGVYHDPHVFGMAFGRWLRAYSTRTTQTARDSLEKSVAEREGFEPSVGCPTLA